MSLLRENLPQIKAFDRLDGLEFAPDEQALIRWNAALAPKAEDADNVISILDVIGEDWWTGEGTTAKRVSAALRKIGDREVIVNLNSPGGDFFEGVAIYNLLREHSQKVTVKILGLAASAASVIAMAGDEILISDVGFIMIHNAWAIAIGNRHDMLKAAATLEPFDEAMAALYAKRAGQDKAAVAKWMDDETYFNGAQAVENGLATGFLPSSEVSETQKSQARAFAAVRRIDLALAKTNTPRSERRRLLAEVKGATHNAAAQPATHDAGINAALERLIATIRP